MKHKEHSIGAALPPDKMIEVEQVVLHKIRRRSNTRIPIHLLANTEFELLTDIMTQGAIMHLDTVLLGHHLQDPVLTVSYPADWWQHFKQRWFPAWAKKRWPVEMKEVTEKYSISAVYPEFEFHLPDDRHYLTVTKLL